MPSRGVRNIAEIDAGDKLLRRHIAEQLPQRLALDFGPQVPHRVDHCGSRHVNNPLLRPDPAQLAIARNMPPERAHISSKRLQTAPDDEWSQRPDSSDTHLI